ARPPSRPAPPPPPRRRRAPPPRPGSGAPRQYDEADGLLRLVRQARLDARPTNELHMRGADVLGARTLYRRMNPRGRDRRLDATDRLGVAGRAHIDGIAGPRRAIRRRVPADRAVGARP